MRKARVTSRALIAALLVIAFRWSFPDLKLSLYLKLFLKITKIPGPRFFLTLASRGRRGQCEYLHTQGGKWFILLA